MEGQSYLLNLLLRKTLIFSLLLPIKSPMNAPEVKQIIRLVMAKKLSPIDSAIGAQRPTRLERSTITTQIAKPITQAPPKRNVALLEFVKGDCLNLR